MWVLGRWMDNMFIVSEVCNVTSLSLFIAGSSSFLLWRMDSGKSSWIKIPEPFKCLALCRTESLSCSLRHLTTMGRGLCADGIYFPSRWIPSNWPSCSFSQKSFLTFSSVSQFFFTRLFNAIHHNSMASGLGLQIVWFVWDWDQTFADCVQICLGFITHFKIIKSFLNLLKDHPPETMMCTHVLKLFSCCSNIVL